MKDGEELYKELDYHLLNDDIPSNYLNDLYNNSELQLYPFKLLSELQKTEQSPKHHPEGNVWNHTLLVINEAAKLKNRSKNPTAFMWAALLHDIGKPSTTKYRNGKITSYDHDKIGAKLARDFLSEFTKDDKFINDVCILIRYHMQILFVVNNMSFADIKGLKENADINEVALLGLCDRLGRTNYNKIEEENNIKLFIKKFEE